MNTWLAFLLIINVMLNIGGTYLLRLAVADGFASYAVLGAGCYTIASALFVFLLQQNQQLAVLGTITSILGLIAVVLIGRYIFSEPLLPIQWIGIGTAIASVVLISFPSFTS